MPGTLSGGGAFVTERFRGILVLAYIKVQIGKNMSLPQYHGKRRLVQLATLFLIATARADEAECIPYFGQSYREYMKKTKMFIPLLF